MEIIRRLMRDLLGYNSEIYRFASEVLNCISTVKKDGITTWKILKKLMDDDSANLPIRSITLNNLMHPIFLRADSNDVITITNNVIREEYGRFKPKRKPKWIIDAGAYIGDTAAYFLSKYPYVKVIALEPNPENYEMAKMNLEPYGERCFLLKKGLYYKDGVQYFSGSQTSSSIAESGIEIECTTISSLIEQFSIPFIDILKIDIEGAEYELFKYNPDAWLNSVGLLIIEMHGYDTEAFISSVLRMHGFSMRRYRSVWYCQRK